MIPLPQVERRTPTRVKNSTTVIAGHAQRLPTIFENKGGP